jgi:RNA polymerase sigma-70 factor (ECF subfamily)
VLNGDDFVECFRAAAPALRVVAVAQVGQSDADDVVQQAAIVAWERRDRFEEGTDFRAWMAAIVRNAARNHRRGNERQAERHRRVASSSEVESSSGLGSATEYAGTTAGAMVSAGVDAADGLSDELRGALEGLSEDQRACLLLRVLLDHSYEEIAAITGVNAVTARSHVRRARLRMAGALETGGQTDV